MMTWLRTSVSRLQRLRAVRLGRAHIYALLLAALLLGVSGTLSALLIPRT
jgi:hypothetical protein